MTHLAPPHALPPQISVLDATAADQLILGKGSSEYVLEAKSRGIMAIEDLGKYTKLRSLDLAFNQLTDLTGALGKLPDLREVKVYGNRLTSLGGLDRNGRLEKLLAQDNGLTALPASLANLKSLKVLRVDRNHLTSIASLARCSSLTYLDVSNNTLTSLKGLQNMVALEEFLADGNEVKDLQGHLTDCRRLAGLHLSDNHLTSLAGLKCLVSLEILHVRRNRLSTLDSMPTLAALTELYLNGNRLTSISRIAGAAPRLDVLDIRENRLGDLDAIIRTLSALPELKELWMGANPCTPYANQGTAKWWWDCAKRVPRVERLDDTPTRTTSEDTELPSSPPSPSSPASLASPRPSSCLASPRPPIAGRPSTSSGRPLIHAAPNRIASIERVEPLSSLEAQTATLKGSLRQLRSSIREGLDTPRHDQSNAGTVSISSRPSTGRDRGASAMIDATNPNMTINTTLAAAAAASSCSNDRPPSSRSLVRALSYSKRLESPLALESALSATDAPPGASESTEAAVSGGMKSLEQLLSCDLEEEYQRLMAQTLQEQEDRDEDFDVQTYVVDEPDDEGEDGDSSGRDGEEVPTAAPKCAAVELPDDDRLQLQKPIASAMHMYSDTTNRNYNEEEDGMGLTPGVAVVLKKSKTRVCMSHDVGEGSVQHVGTARLFRVPDKARRYLEGQDCRSQQTS